MNRKIFALLAPVFAAAAASATLAACGGNDEPPPEEKKYPVTVQADEGCTAQADKKQAEFGESVTVTVTVTDPDMYIEGVYFNDTEVSGDGSYTYTVTGDTTVKVELAAYEEVYADGGVTFSSSNRTSVPVNGGNGGAWQGNEWVDEIWSWNVGLSWLYTAALSDRSSVTSSNKSVAPDDAFTIEGGDKGSSAFFTSAEILIDTRKLSPGTTWLTIFIQSNNTSSNRGTLYVKLEVTKEGTAADIVKWTESVTFDISDVLGSDLFDADKLYFQFVDKDYSSDMQSKEYQTFYMRDCTVTDGKVTVEAEYVEGHEYAVYVGIEGSGDSLVLGDNINGTGGSYDHEQNVLTFQRDGGSIEIRVYDERVML